MLDRPIVCKFGGTSLADAGRFAQVRDIVKSDSRRRYIVVSAPGKRHPEDIKITDRLISAYANGEPERESALDGARAVFRAIAAELGLRPYDHELDSLTRAAETSRDLSASRGEWLCAKMLAEYIGLPFADAAELFVFHDGALDERETYARIRSLPRQGAVVPGFYGADALGEVVTFPRGGSDISGAHVAAALNARAYENWTDVDGFHAADPHLVTDSPAIPALSYAQARTFSKMGAGVLHYDCLAPVETLGIPVVVKNTFRPEAPGTRITGKAHWDQPFLAVSKGAAGTCRITILGADENCAARVFPGMPDGSTVSQSGWVVTITCPESRVREAARSAYAASLPARRRA